MNFNSFVDQLRQNQKQVIAEWFASAAYERFSDYLTEDLFAQHFLRKKLATTPELAREVMALVFHGFAGVAHTISFKDGVPSSIVSRIVGNIFADIAGGIRRIQSDPVIIDLGPSDYWTDVRGMATKRLMEKFEDARVHEMPDNNSTSRVRAFLRQTSQFLNHEIIDLTQVIDDLDFSLITAEEQRTKKRRRS